MNYTTYTYNAPEIAKTVKLGRLRWLGHLTRANETSPCRTLTFPKPKGTRRAGRPSVRWLESSEKGCSASEEEEEGEGEEEEEEESSICIKIIALIHEKNRLIIINF
jgi:hypothetical protein